MSQIAKARGGALHPVSAETTRLSLAASSAAPPRVPKAHARTEPLPVSKWSAATLSDRVRALCAGKTPQSISRVTGVAPDCVRRYLRGAAVPPSFLLALASEMDVSLNWLLSGRGPIRRSEVVAMALDRSSNTELLTELARRLMAGPAGEGKAA